MIDFNEPLPNILEHEAIHTNPISNGDARLSARDLDATLGNVSSKNSRLKIKNHYYPKFYPI